MSALCLLRSVPSLRAAALCLGVLLPWAAASAEPVEWRWSLGGEIGSDSHGVADLGVRSGPWSAQWITDTLDLRYSPELSRGRLWAAVRGSAFASQMVISPWSDGVPRPDLALVAPSLGPEVGAVVYGPSGLWFGAAARVRGYQFAPRGDATGPVPDDRVVWSGEGLAGWWSPQADLSARGGLDAWDDQRAPYVHLIGRVRPEGEWAPTARVWAGVADNQDFLVTTRLGGLNPYVVPLAGASWAEFRVEDYAALRAGPSWQGDDAELALVADAVLFDGRGDLGVALLARSTPGGHFVEAALGVSPTIERQVGISRVSAWFVFGRPWRAGPAGR